MAFRARHPQVFRGHNARSTVLTPLTGLHQAPLGSQRPTDPTAPAADEHTRSTVPSYTHQRLLTAPLGAERCQYSLLGSCGSALPPGGSAHSLVPMRVGCSDCPGAELFLGSGGGGGGGGEPTSMATTSSSSGARTAERRTIVSPHPPDGYFGVKKGLFSISNPCVRGEKGHLLIPLWEGKRDILPYFQPLSKAWEGKRGFSVFPVPPCRGKGGFSLLKPLCKACGGTLSSVGGYGDSSTGWLRVCYGAQPGGGAWARCGAAVWDPTRGWGPGQLRGRCGTTVGPKRKGGAWGQCGAAAGPNPGMVPGPAVGRLRGQTWGCCRAQPEGGVWGPPGDRCGAALAPLWGRFSAAMGRLRPRPQSRAWGQLWGLTQGWGLGAAMGRL